MKEEQIMLKKDNQNTESNFLILRVFNQILNFKSSETVFMVFAVGVSFIAFILQRDLNKFRSVLQDTNIEFTTIYDFWISIVSMLIIFGFRALIKKYAYDLINQILHDKSEGPNRPKEIKKMLKWIGDVTYYSMSTILGFLIMKDSDFLPYSFMGSGQCSNLFTYNPSATNTYHIKLFILIEFGCQLHALVDQFLFKRKEPKFWEMLLHHILACGLIYYSYSFQYYKVAALVLLAHDPGDVFLCIARFYNNVKNKNILLFGAFLATSLFVWFYTRLYVFPTCIIKSGLDKYITDTNSTDELIMARHNCHLFMLSMLCILLVMHFYWFSFLLKATVTGALAKGNIKNDYDGIKTIEKQTNKTQ